MLIKRASEPRQFVRVEKPRDLSLRVLEDTETGVSISFSQAPFLGPGHYREQYLKHVVGCAEPLPTRRVEPGDHVLRADAVKRHPAECGQNAGLEIDPHSLSSRGVDAKLKAGEHFIEKDGVLLLWFALAGETRREVNLRQGSFVVVENCAVGMVQPPEHKTDKPLRIGFWSRVTQLSYAFGGRVMVVPKSVPA